MKRDLSYVSGAMRACVCVGLHADADVRWGRDACCGELFSLRASADALDALDATDATDATDTRRRKPRRDRDFDNDNAERSKRTTTLPPI
jgi:hypothetical protein